MTVLETIRSEVESYLSELMGTDSVHIDFVEEMDGCAGVSLMGDKLLRRDIWGNQTRTSDLLIYMVAQGVNDYERQANTEALAELGLHLDNIKHVAITATYDGTEREGEIDSVNVSEASVYTVSEDGVYTTYQMKVAVVYEIIESEDW